MKELSKDTINVINYKDSTAKTGKASQIIVIQEKKTEPVKQWYENPLVASLLIPIIITSLTFWVTKWANRKKEKADQEKVSGEIEKLKTENDKIRKSFQPIVVSSLQTIQNEVLKIKIDALKQLNEIKRDFFEYDGPPLSDDYTPDTNDYYEHVFFKFNTNRSEGFKKFLLQYSYVFPDVVIKRLKAVGSLVEDLTITNSSMDSDHLNPDLNDLNRVKELIEKTDEAIKALRSDLHLDNDFIHKFIEQNQDIK
jgi:hypothetical protein